MTPAGFVRRVWSSPAAAALVPLSWAYRAGLAARARLVRPERVGVPVVSVGNLVVGGSGKTPLVLHLVAALRAAGRRVAIVSRGHGGAVARRNGISIASDGAGSRRPAAEVGDEPVLLAARLPDVPVVVAPDRVAAARLAVRRFRPDVLVADDAFQHLALGRDIDVVCVDARDDLERLRLLPAGPLREPPAALDRADVVVATKAEGDDAAAAVARLRRLAPRAAVLSAALRVGAPRGLDGAPLDLRGREVVVAAGIARPADFAAAAAATGARVVARLFFDDHRPFGPVEIGIVAAAAAPDRIVAITEKDAARWPADPAWRRRVAVLPVDLEPSIDLAGWILRRLEPCPRQF